jgi:hypothetical protein
MIKNYISVYIPSTINANESLTPARQKKIISQVSEKLSLKYGGCTAYKVKGFYNSKEKGLINESITIIKAYHTDIVQAAYDFIVSIAKDIKLNLNQESITIETNEGLDFI